MNLDMMFLAGLSNTGKCSYIFFYQLHLPLNSPLPGSELTKEPFRWDQRLFALVLRLPGAASAEPEQLGSVPTDESAITQMCEVTGGNWMLFCFASHLAFALEYFFAFNSPSPLSVFSELLCIHVNPCGAFLDSSSTAELIPISDLDVRAFSKGSRRFWKISLVILEVGFAHEFFEFFFFNLIIELGRTAISEMLILLQG